MTAASTSDARKRNAAQADPVEIVARRLYAMEPEWSYSYRRNREWSETSWHTRFALTNRARHIIAALRENGFTL